MIEETIRAIIVPVYPNVYISAAPVDLDSCVWIRAAAGTSIVHFEKTTYDRLEFTIGVRDLKNAKALDTVDGVYHLLANYVGKGFVILAKRLPHFVGRDAKDRAVYSFQIEYQIGGY